MLYFILTREYLHKHSLKEKLEFYLLYRYFKKKIKKGEF
jgi:hypothetical protein